MYHLWLLPATQAVIADPYIHQGSRLPRTSFSPVNHALGVEQEISAGFEDVIMQVLLASQEYFDRVVLNESKYEPVRESCQNQHELCSFWAANDECDINPDWMTVNCAPACQSCERLDVRVRCPLNPSMPDALLPGDLNRLFQRITSDTDLVKKYNPQILSCPRHLENRETCMGEDGYEEEDAPWIVIFENFATTEETDRLIELGAMEGYRRSKDVGSEQFDGTFDDHVSEYRTSFNAWCERACATDPLAMNVRRKIEEVTGIPELNSEELQLLRYEEGQVRCS